MLKALQLIVLFSSLLLSSTAFIADDNASNCLLDCQLSIEDEVKTRSSLMKKISDKTNRVVYFDITNDTSYVNNSIYAWVQKDVGMPLFELPLEYVAASFGLPTVFIEYQNVTFNESTPNCYQSSSQYCQKILLFTAFIQLSGLENYRCNTSREKPCGTICRRHFHFLVANDSERISYSCCPINGSKVEIDFAKCLEIETFSSFIPQLDIITVITAILMSLMLVAVITNEILGYLGR